MRIKTCLISFVTISLLACCKRETESNPSKEFASNGGTVMLYYSLQSKDSLITPDSLVVKIAGRKAQHIQLNHDIFWDNATDIPFDTLDINFDGYEDLRLLNYQGQYNSTYNFYVFDPGRKIYIRNHSADSLYNVAPVYNDNILCSVWRVGLNEFHHDTYKWNSNKLQPLSSITEYWPVTDTLHGILTTIKYDTIPVYKAESVITEPVISGKYYSCD